MDKMRMESIDMTAQNIERIGELFPNCITETRDENGKLKKAINFEMLRQMLSSDIADGDEAYEFTWVGKKASIVEANKPIRKTLRPCPEESVDWDKTENLYIEGDNLEVLKLLQESYLGSVKMIYIDPPYNTGNDFIYNDDFKVESEEWNVESGVVDEDGNRMFRNTDSNGRFHSDWCSMIYSRLMLARNLLSDDGVIFISIDDNEQATLKAECDEIFGSDNFILQIAWRRTDNQPNIGTCARVKEYILLYAKNKSRLLLGRLPLSESAKAEYRYEDAKGLFRRGILLHKTRGRKFYPKTTKLGNTLNGPWMVTEEEFDRLDANGEIYWTTSGDGQPYSKIYLSNSKGAIPNDFWGIEYGTNQRASLEVEKLFNKRYFDFPKAVSLIKTLTVLGTPNKDTIILDFFSGSATTAHAVMQLNAEDGGNRKFIMVQLPEKCDEKSEAYKAGYKNICEIGKERIRRAGAKIKEEMKQNSTLHSPNSTLDTGFRVFKLDDSNMNDVYYSPDEYNQGKLKDLESNIKSDRTDLDLLFGCLLDWGLPLSMPYTSEKIDGFTVHTYNDGDLIACFDENVPESVIKEIAKRKPLRAVFRDSSFENSPAKINVEEIFKLLAPDTRVKVI
ncbi:MAG: site-specific DNA-methyltransferase [Synergistaceae bacterium]|nr:site-specific DNA-methyltransferase [Synergistaceae bacterium]